MISVSSTIEVTACPQAVLEMVLDLEAYRRVDPKIRRVLSPVQLDESGHGQARVVGSLWRLPPAPDTHDVHLERWERLTFRGSRRAPARLLFEFTGRFDVVPTAGGCTLTHGYEVRFRRPLAALLDRRVTAWLRRDLEDELVRLSSSLQAESEAGRRRVEHVDGAGRGRASSVA